MSNRGPRQVIGEGAFAGATRSSQNASLLVGLLALRCVSEPCQSLRRLYPARIVAESVCLIQAPPRCEKGRSPAIARRGAGSGAGSGLAPHGSMAPAGGAAAEGDLRGHGGALGPGQGAAGSPKWEPTGRSERRARSGAGVPSLSLSLRDGLEL